MKNIAVIFLIFAFIAGETPAQKKYWGAEVRSKQSYLYGKFEVRMKSAQGSGIASTFFTYNTASDKWNEIDIEIMGRYKNQVSFNTYIPNKTAHPHREIVNFNPAEDYHEYAIEWTPDFVAWCIDGHEIYKQEDERIKKNMNLPQSIVLSIWPSNHTDWAGELDTAKLPLYADYDWVKYYSYKPELKDKFKFEWKDSFADFDTTRWEKASHTFPNNLSDFKPVNVVIKNGKMILCLTKRGQGGIQLINDEDIEIKSK